MCEKLHLLHHMLSGLWKQWALMDVFVQSSIEVLPRTVSKNGLRGLHDVFSDKYTQ